MTEAQKDEVIERVSVGETISAISADEHMPATSTIWLELQRDDAFSDRYAKAKEKQLLRMEEDLLAIADNVSTVSRAEVDRARLQIDARKWVMSKRLPKKYGERVEQAIGPNDEAKAMAEAGQPWAIVTINGKTMDGGEK